MQSIQIWHNEKCSKSRAALELLNASGIDIEVIDYLEKTPSKDEIKVVLSLLNTNARGLMRGKEQLYKELNLNDDSLSEETLIQNMFDNPSLIERPVVIYNAKAAIGRPIENILELISFS